MGLFTWRWAVTSAVRRGGQWTLSGPSVAHSCSCGPSRTRLAGEGAYIGGRPQPGDMSPWRRSVLPFAWLLRHCHQPGAVLRHVSDLRGHPLQDSADGRSHQVRGHTAPLPAACWYQWLRLLLGHQRALDSK